ncbi:Cof-type HAD-IIB family hydrolase [Corynebacterium aurimucosum]|uniref:HAD family hydrolase n=1 Tax=Corynebacterium TaxID=1716 RepID=UPI0008A4E2CE|nr:MULTISPECIES: HAD family hydrolase [Corynebacterium]OFQ33366.1 phosphatase [Corynebacterium sp. HMSC072D12]QQU95075.1 HAD family phosphatase [Corynebacterium aurimucosum]UTA72018.1 HAD family phosphatase [Corynebacterium aurimucosum]WJY70295.1 Sugar phosphatase YidA [Corynebacterium aurimucosum]
MKIAALDMDGTVYVNEDITEAVKEAIAAWRAAGNLAISATGKSIANARNTLEPFGVELDYHVLYNGTVITDGDYSILHEEHLPSDTVQAIIDRFTGLPLNIYLTGLTGADQVAWDGLAGRESSMVANTEVVDPGDVAKRSTVLMSLWIPGDAELRREVDEWVRANCDVESSFNCDFYDIMPPGHNKGEGLTRLLGHLGHEEAELYTFGDSFNDLSMHSIATESFTFPGTHITDEVDHVVPDVAAGLSILLDR